MRSFPSPLSRWERGRGEGRRASIEGKPQFRANPRQDKIEIIRDFLVGQAHGAQAEPFENFGPPGVAVRKPFMLLVIPPDRSPGVDNELGGMAIEIHNETIERDLPPEFRAVKARAAQALSKRLLRPGLMLAQSFGEFAPRRSHGTSPSPLPLSRRERGFCAPSERHGRAFLRHQQPPRGNGERSSGALSFAGRFRLSSPSLSPLVEDAYGPHGRRPDGRGSRRSRGQTHLWHRRRQPQRLHRFAAPRRRH
jgi:hypothetical protein